MGLIYDMEYILGGNQGRCNGITIKICETLDRSQVILYYLIQRHKFKHNRDLMASTP